MADIKAIAEKLVSLYKGSIPEEIVQIFKELGIDVVVIMTEGLNDDHHSITAEQGKAKAKELECTVAVQPAPKPPRIKPFVPRTIGKPRSFPRNMRRHK